MTKPSPSEMELVAASPQWLKALIENSDILILTQDEWVTIPYQVRAYLSVMKY